MLNMIEQSEPIGIRISANMTNQDHFLATAE